MANPQLENGHTKIANELLDNYMKLHLSPNQWQVYLCILRKTYGYHKKTDMVANIQIVQATGIKKSHVSRAMAELATKNLIVRDGKQVSIQKDWELWGKVTNTGNQKLPISATKVTNFGNKTNSELPISATKVTSIGNQKLPISATKVTSPVVTQKIKDIKIKDNIKKLIKKETLILPEWINKDIWNEFLKVRKLMKAVCTPHAEGEIIKELTNLKNNGDNPNEILNQSIMNSWKGVFPLKHNGGKYAGVKGLKGYTQQPGGVTQEYTE